MLQPCFWATTLIANMLYFQVEKGKKKAWKRSRKKNTLITGQYLLFMLSLHIALIFFYNYHLDGLRYMYFYTAYAVMNSWNSEVNIEQNTHTQ